MAVVARVAALQAETPSPGQFTVFQAKVAVLHSAQMEQMDLVVEEVAHLSQEKMVITFWVGTVSLSFATKLCCKSFQNVAEKRNDVKRNEFKIIVTCKCIYPSRTYVHVHVHVHTNCD